MFLLSLDEVDRVKRAHGLTSNAALEARTGVSERTWRTAMKQRRPTPQVLDALETLGARADRVLIAEDRLSA